MMNGVKGKTPLYTTEGASAALSWWSLLLLHMVPREDPTSGRYPYTVCPRMQDMWKTLSGKYSYCPQVHTPLALATGVNTCKALKPGCFTQHH